MIRKFVTDLELYLRMSACPVHHLGYFLITSLGAETAEKVRRSHFADLIADYATFKSGVNALFGKFKCKESLREQLRTHAQSGAKSIAAYAARTTDVCSKAYPAFARKTQLLLAVEHFIACLADITTLDYLLHDRACCSLLWQDVVHMAQACEASRFLLHAHSTFFADASPKVDTPALVERKCTHDETTVAHASQAKSARDGRVSNGAHLLFKEDSRARTNASRPTTPQKNDSPSPARCSHSPCTNSENSAHAPYAQGKIITKPRAITIFTCCASGHVASA